MHWNGRCLFFCAPGFFLRAPGLQLHEDFHERGCHADGIG